jgi:hypothetical protein
VGEGFSGSGEDMKITEIGNYRLTKDIVLRGPNCVATFPEGAVLKITQIDKDYKKVIGPDLLDWQYYEMPVVRI